jgi:hypothetical protein
MPAKKGLVKKLRTKLKKGLVENNNPSTLFAGNAPHLNINVNINDSQSCIQDGRSSLCPPLRGNEKINDEYLMGNIDECSACFPFLPTQELNMPSLCWKMMRKTMTIRTLEQPCSTRQGLHH